jgi:alkaline phosphatase D
LLAVLSKKKGNLIVLSGDIHASFVFKLKSGSQPLNSDPIGFEFVVPSITSQNFDDKMKWEPRTLSCDYEAALLELLPQALWCDLDGHGYNVIDVYQDRVQVEYWHVQTVLQRSDRERVASLWKIRHGETSIERVDKLKSF